MKGFCKEIVKTDGSTGDKTDRKFKISCSNINQELQ